MQNAKHCTFFEHLFAALASLFFFSIVTLLYDSYFSRAQTNSDVFVLTKKDLDEVLTHYPQIRKKILETAEERQRMVAERAKAFAKKKEEDKKREEENKLKVFFNYENCRKCRALIGSQTLWLYLQMKTHFFQI